MELIKETKKKNVYQENLEPSNLVVTSPLWIFTSADDKLMDYGAEIFEYRSFFVTMLDN